MVETFAAWVEPTATSLAAERAQVIAFARATPHAFWERASVVEGWLNRDVLAHLAGGNDQMVQTVLRAVVNRYALDAAALDPDTDAENAARVAERRGWTIEELIAELERDGDQVQMLLCGLQAADEHVRPAGAGMSLGEFLRIVREEHHDALHLAQLAGPAK